MDVSNSREFYESVSTFDRFIEVADPRHYREVPEDWLVIITDIEGSTKAIEENRYKEVNMLGAATIAAALNALGGRKIPFVFGGDGATLLIHGSDLTSVAPALRATQKMAETAYRMRIRIGVVPVADLRREGASVHVARFRVSEQANLAMVRGGGLGLAEKWIKSPELGDRYRLRPSEDGAEGAATLDGLSCRWSPIPARKGEMISLLVLALGTHDRMDKTYVEVMREIEAIFHREDEARPLTLEKLLAMKRKFSPSNLKPELSLRMIETRSLAKRARVLVGAAIAVVSVFVGVRLRLSLFPGFDPIKYAAGLAANTDFRKFDDMLRMISDCETAQRERLVAFLERLRGEGKLVYGLHVSSHALMTCLVFTTDDHIHFIDGSGGGYAMAAWQLKEQLRALDR